jgi:hypothetical protein
MYHPYFRGKQYELITIRELAPLLKKADFCPIIEPVRESLSGLRKALDAVGEVDGNAILVVNPYHGDLSGAGMPLTELLKEKYLDLPGVRAGILLRADTSLNEVEKYCETHAAHSPVLIHAGFTEARALAEMLDQPMENQYHVFFDRHCGKLYQKHFKGAYRVLLHDGFQRMRNRDYELLEAFSDLHATFEDEGMNGFGDFLIVGDEYTEEGGPAYAVAIHLTFIDPDRDDAMYIYHFKSQRQDTPQDPAGKFAEALDRMMRVLDKPNSKVLETGAVKEFRTLHKQKHFPGLGYVKKLSMNHHIETLAEYFKIAT